MKFFLCVVLAVSSLQLVSCNYLTYTPRSKSSVRREKPSIMVLNSIVEFRNEHRRWPENTYELTNSSVRWYKAFEGFPYNYTRFKITDSNNMTFYFADHVQDRASANETGLVDLNSYNGQAKFYPENGKFVWKLKMK